MSPCESGCFSCAFFFLPDRRGNICQLGLGRAHSLKNLLIVSCELNAKPELNKKLKSEQKFTKF